MGARSNDQPPSTSTACPGGWINGSLNGNNSHYKEDEVVPQRWVLDVTAPGSLTQHTITFRYEARKANAHAYDSLATWNYTQSSADRCQDLLPTDCPSGPATTYPIPDDPTSVQSIGSFGNDTVYLVDSGVPAFTDVPWLSESPASGTVAVGASQAITLGVDTTGMAPGTYGATLFVQSNSGRQPSLRVPVKLIVPAYETGANAGSSDAPRW